MSDSPTITQQYSFAVGEDGETDGSIEPAEESVETDLETWGANVDHRERDSRIDQPEATSFGVDDRPEVVSSDGGKQGALFADTTDDQRTLTGERAASQCLFETDDNDSDEPAETGIDGVATTQAVATDGGHVEDSDDSEDDAENENATVAIPRKELAAVADYVEYERNAVERHAGDGPKTEELTEYVEECRSVLSVLDDTDENGRIRRVVAAGAADELHGAAKKRTGEVGQKLQRLVDVLRQALDEQPQSDEDERTDTETENADAASDREPMTDGGQDETFDPDEETVTEAWEGAFIYTSWGYDQTNVELARIIEVSGSGKTVLARRVGAERVGHGRTSKQLRPSAEQFGDEFRLYVRTVSDDPAFRGSYPLGRDADMDGPTRQGSFYPFDNREGNSIRETRTNFGH